MFNEFMLSLKTSADKEHNSYIKGNSIFLNDDFCISSLVSNQFSLCYFFSFSLILQLKVFIVIDYCILKINAYAIFHRNKCFL